MLGEKGLLKRAPQHGAHSHFLMMVCSLVLRSRAFALGLAGLLSSALISLQNPPFLIAWSHHPVLEVRISPGPTESQALLNYGTSWRCSERTMRVDCALFPARKYNSQQVLDIVLILRILRLLRVIVSIQR